MSILSGITGGQNPFSFLQSQLFNTPQASSSTSSTASSTSSSSSGSSSSSSSSPNLGGWLAAQMGTLQGQVQNSLSQPPVTPAGGIGHAPPSALASQLLYGTAGGTSGPITRSQFDQAYATEANQAFSALDQNGDGTISTSEAQAALQNPSSFYDPQSRLAGPAAMLYAQMMAQ